MKHLLSAAAILISYSLSAQRNFTEAFIVLSSGDTLHGEIDYREWSLNPDHINFRTGTQTEPKKYEVADLHFFEIKDREAYQAARVKISMDPIDVSEVKMIDTSFYVADVFLRVLEKGSVANLYYYRDKLKERFYIKQAVSDQYEELLFRRYHEYDYVSVLKTDYRFRDQLMSIARSAGVLTPELLGRIEKTSYKRGSLVQLINRINGKDKTATKSNDGKITFFLGGGMQYVTLSSKGIEYYTQNPDKSSSASPHIAGGLDFFNNRHTEKFIIRGEFGFGSRNYKSEGINGMNLSTRNDVKAVHEAKGTVISFSPRLLFNIYNTKNLKIPLGVGGSAHYANYSKNTYTEMDAGDGKVLRQEENYFKLEPFYLSTHFSGGVVINNKLEASVLFQPRTAIINYQYFSIGNSILQLQVSYLFR